MMNVRININTFKQKKINGQKITMLTAYDYSTAKLLDHAGVDSLLVGDSLGMVMLGYEDTTKVTMEDMLHHVKAVSRGVTNAMVIADMPFLSYHTGIRDSVINAGKFIQQGNAQAVKIEGGGTEITDCIKAILNAGIPVIGHLGLTPQSVNKFGGYGVQGKTLEHSQRLIEDALALEEAGVFSIVLECIPAPLAEIITKKLRVPTIGIGAGVDCDGQVLVTHDLLGLYSDMTPKFVKQYTNLGSSIKSGVKDYIEEVQNNMFPDDKHSFKMEREVYEELRIIYNIND